MSLGEGYIIFMFAKSNQFCYSEFNEKMFEGLTPTQKIYLGGPKRLCMLCFGKSQTKNEFSEATELEIFGDTAFLSWDNNVFAPIASTEADAKKIVDKWMYLIMCCATLNLSGELKYKVDIATNRHLFYNSEKNFVGFLDLEARKYSTHIIIGEILHCIKYTQPNFLRNKISEQIRLTHYATKDFLRKKKDDANFKEWCDFCVKLATAKITIDKLIGENPIARQMWTETKSTQKFLPMIDVELNNYYCHIDNMTIQFDPQLVKISFGAKFNYELSLCTGKNFLERVTNGLEWIKYYSAAKIKDGDTLNFNLNSKLFISEYGIREEPIAAIKII